MQKKNTEKPAVAKLFKNGSSQAVRLPKQFRFKGKQVLVSRRGDRVILEPMPKKTQSKSAWIKGWEDFFYNTPLASPDFMKDYKDLPPQKRKF